MTTPPGWRRLSTGDLMALWAQTPATPNHIAMLGLLAPDPPPDPPRDRDPDPPPDPLRDRAGRLRLASLRSAIEDRLDRAPALRRRIRSTHPGQGRPVWVDDDAFDIARHVDTVDLPGIDLDRLLTWAASDAATALPTDRPLWRLTFVDGLASGEIGMLLVMHHALADGLDGVTLATALLDASPDEHPAPARWAPAPRPEAGALLRDAAAGRLHGLAHLGPRLGQLPGLRRDLRTARTVLAPPAPDLHLPQPPDPRRSAAALRWPLAAVRAAGHRYGVTINDLMLAVLAAGMRDLLAARGLPVADLALRVSVPVAAPAGTHNAGGTMPLVLTLPVGDPDPETNLRRIAFLTARAKASRDRSYPGPAHSPLLPLSAVRLGVRWLRRNGGSRVNLYLTNVPGPADPLWLSGARLRVACPIAPVMAGVPLAVAILSYADSLSLSVNAAPDLDLKPFAEAADRAAGQLRFA